MKIIITGAAGLVGQNLIIELLKSGNHDIVGIDKHPDNTKILKQLHPEISVYEANVADPGKWEKEFVNADVLIILHAQIGALDHQEFIKNNVEATRHILKVSKNNHIPYLIHISSSVVESVAEDGYTNSKKEQEALVVASGLKYCILRPTLMFGWFDRKHLGWLSRFMKCIPVFPIPGHGRYMRQPLYVRDFCRIIVSCVNSQKQNEIFNITGKENIDYIDIIRSIKKAIHAFTWIVKIPFSLFWWLLRIYAVFDKDPPFTTEQLEALMAGDEFEMIPWWDIFDVAPTSFNDAIAETFCDEQYSNIELKF